MSDLKLLNNDDIIKNEIRFKQTKIDNFFVTL